MSRSSEDLEGKPKVQGSRALRRGGGALAALALTLALAGCFGSGSSSPSGGLPGRRPGERPARLDARLRAGGRTPDRFARE